MMVPQRRTVDGFEEHFGVNYLGHFLLTRLLLDTLVRSGRAGRSARVVTVSSATHYVGTLDLDDLQSRCVRPPHVPSPPRPPAGERGHRRPHAGPRPAEVTPVSGLWPFVSNPCHSGGCHGDAHGATEHFPPPSARLRANRRQLLFPCDGAHAPVLPA